MNSLISFLTSKEIIFVYILAGLACGVCLIVYLVERNNENLRKKHNTRELNKLVEQIVEELDAEEARINYETPVLETIETIEDTNKVKKDTPMKVAPISVKEDNSLESSAKKVEKQETIEELEEIEELEYTSSEPDQETAKLELKRLEEQLIREEQMRIEIEKRKAEAARLQEVELQKQEAARLEAIRQEELRREQEIRIQAYEQEQERLRQEAEAARIRKEQEEMARQEALRQEEEKKKLLEEQSENIQLTAFEEEQEKTAIISMDELLQKSRELYAANEVTQYKDEGNEPISLKDLENIMDKDNQTEEPYIIANVVEENENKSESKVEVIDQRVMEKMKMSDYKAILENRPEEVKYQQLPQEPSTKQQSTFKSSPIISPIFGIEKEADNNLELENTANYEKLDEQIKKSNNFIVSLKELQENLD